MSHPVFVSGDRQIVLDDGLLRAACPLFLALLCAAAAPLDSQTVPVRPQLVRHCTPAAWQAADVQWIRDTQPHNKIDDSIDVSTEPLFDIVVPFKRCVRDSDVVRLQQLSPQSTLEMRSEFLPFVALAGVRKSEVRAIARLPQVAFVERQIGFSGTLDVSVSAIQVAKGFHSPNTVADLAPELDGSGVNIAVMDSGVDDAIHRTFRGAVHGFDAVTGSESNPDDDLKHGTLVASIALGKGAPVMLGPQVQPGVAPGAGLVDVRIIDAASDPCDVFATKWMWVTEGLHAILRNQATWKVQVINMSFRQCDAFGKDVKSDGLDAFSQLVDLAESMGIVVVAGASREGTRGLPSPAAATRAITVAASDDKDTEDRSDDTIADSFSNFGPRDGDGDLDELEELKPEVTAPGVNIKGAAFDTSAGVFESDGTSFAAPHVSGLVALILQERPGINPASVKQLLIATADHDKRRGPASRPALDPTWNERWGWGLVSGYEAIAALRDATQAADLTFPTPDPDPPWLSPDLSTSPERLEAGKRTTVTAMIRNRSDTVVARRVRVHFGVHDYSTASAFSHIGTRIVDLKPGVTPVSIDWVPAAKGHLCLEVEIGYGPDSDYSNNVAQRNLDFAASPVVFEVQNTLSEAPAEIRFVTTLDPPTTDWVVTVTPPSVVLAADDCPVPIQVLLEPLPTAAPGSRQRVHVAARIGDVELGGVTVEASAPRFPDCNSNGIDDALDIANGTSQDVNGSGRPDECELSSVTWFFSGTAQGGSVTVTVQGSSAICTVGITTTSGQSSADVAAALAAAVTADPCFAAQGITAVASGGALTITGLDLAPFDVTVSGTDPGLIQQMMIPTLSEWGLIILAFLLATAGALIVRRSRTRKGV